MPASTPLSAGQRRKLRKVEAAYAQLDEHVRALKALEISIVSRHLAGQPVGDEEREAAARLRAQVNTILRMVASLTRL